MTELQITLYSGVPFNNKYKDVLFVSRETRETFLNNYSVGDNFAVNRFEIINDNETIVDITNNYNGFECNYAKVHTKLQPETSNQIYERDTFYFVNSARQIGTNVVRLTLEKDVFQTDFNKYNYSITDYQIPQIKNGRCILTNNEQDDFANIKNKTLLTVMKEYNKKITFTPLYPAITDYHQVYVVFEYTTNKGISTYCGIVSLPTFVLGVDTYVSGQSYHFGDIINALNNPHIYYSQSNNEQIDVIHVYIIPSLMIDKTKFSKLNNAYLMASNTQINIYYGEFNGTADTLTGHFYFDTKTETINVSSDTYTSIGTLERQIELPYNSQNYEVKIDITIASSFHVNLFCNNQSIDLTNNFELSFVVNEYNKYVAQHQSTMAIRQLTDTINLVGSIASFSQGNGTSIITLANTMTDMASNIGELFDMQSRPTTLQCEKNVDNDLIAYNLIGIFESEPSNIIEIQKNAKYFGDKVDFLTNLTLYYKTNTYTENNVSYTINFDYFQFANLELIANLPENIKTTIENMFLQGIRIWYNPTKFLQTIERKEIQV